MNIPIVVVVITGITASLGKITSLLLTLVYIIIFLLFVWIKAPIIRSGVKGLLTIVLFSKEKAAPLLIGFVLPAFVIEILATCLITVLLLLSFDAT